MRVEREREREAKYYCQDIISFCKRNSGKEKFDYILGMYNFLCGIEKEARKEFIDDVYSMLKPCGKIILRVKYIRYNPKEIIRSFVSFLYWTFVMGKRWQLGDVLLRSSKDEFCKSHYFTKKQIRILLNEKKYMINGDTIIIQKC